MGDNFPKSQLAEDSFFEDFGEGSKLDNDYSLVEMSSSYFKDGEFDDQAYLKDNQHHKDALETIKQLKHRLIRRTEIIDEIRKYYLRDIVTVKYIMRDLLTGTERESIYKQYESVLPSLDLKKALILHAPVKTELQIKLCNECGGHLEIISRDSDEVEMLKKVLLEARERENRWRVKLATMDSEIENTAREKAEATKSHFEEKRFLYSEIKRLKDEAEAHKGDFAVLLKSHKKVKEENETFKSTNSTLFEAAAKLEDTEKELDIVKQYMQETSEKLTHVKAAEKIAQRELVATKLEVNEFKQKTEKLAQEMHYIKQENHQHAVSTQRMQESFKQAEKSLEETKQLVEQANFKILTLENEAHVVATEHAKVVDTMDRSIDGLRFEIETFEKLQRRHKKETAHLAEKVKKANAIIRKLKDIKINQELDLLDNAEELQLYEEEINAMQQFIRDKVTHKSFSDHLDTVDMPEVLQKLQSMVQQADNKPPTPVSQRRDPLEMGGSMSTFRSEAAVAETVGTASPSFDLSEGGAENRDDGEADYSRPMSRDSDLGKPGGQKRVRRTAGIRLKQQKEIAPVPGNKNEVKDLAKFTKAPRGNAVIANKRRKRDQRNRANDTIAEDDGEGAAEGEEQEGLEEQEEEEYMDEDERLEREIAEIQLDEEEEELYEAATAAEEEEQEESIVSPKKTKSKKEPKEPKKPKKLKEHKDGSKESSGGGKEPSTEMKSPKAKKSKTAHDSSSSTRKEAKEAKEPKDSSATAKSSSPSKKSSKKPPKVPKKDEDGSAPTEEVSEDVRLLVEGERSLIRTPEKGGTRSHPNSAKISREDAVKVHDSHETSRTIKKAAIKRDKEQRAAKANVLTIGGNGSDVSESEVESEDESEEEPEQVVPVKRTLKKKVKAEIASPVATPKRKPKPKHITNKSEEKRQQKKNKIKIPLHKAHAKRQARYEEGLSDDDLDEVDEDFSVEDSDAASSEEQEEESEEEVSESEEEEEEVVHKAVKKNKKTAASSSPQKKVQTSKTSEKSKHNDKHNSNSNNKSKKSKTKKSKPVAREEIESDQDDDEEQEESDDEQLSDDDVGETEESSVVSIPSAHHSAQRSASHTPKRRRSIPKSFNFRTQILRYAQEHPDDTYEHFAPRDRDQILADIDSAHHSFDSGSINDDDSAHQVKHVPVIPIEVKRYVKAFKPKPVPVMVEKVVDLDPPPEDATKFEIQLREAIVSTVKTYPGVTENMAHTYMNGSAGVIHKHCSMFTGSLESTWESLLINRKSLDFLLKMLIVLEGMISLTSESASNENLAEICARIVPLAGSMPSNLTTQWQEECNISDDIILDLVPMVNYETGERELKKYTRFFDSDSSEKVAEKVALCVETVSKMSHYASESTTKLNTYLVDVLKDWSKAKAVFFDMDARIDAEKEKLRKQLEVRMNALARDVAKINKLYENSLDKVSKLEGRVKELLKVEGQLVVTTAKLEESEYNSDCKTQTIIDLKETTVQAQVDLAASKSLVFEHEGTIAQLRFTLSRTQTELDVTQQRVDVLLVNLEKMTAEKERFESQFNAMVAKEEERRRNQTTAGTQCDPSVTSIAIQTEFLVPPMELRTVVANKVSREGIQKYPQIMSEVVDHFPLNYVAQNIHNISNKHSKLPMHAGQHLPVQVGPMNVPRSTVNYGASGSAKVYDVASNFHVPQPTHAATNSHHSSVSNLLGARINDERLDSRGAEARAHFHSTSSAASMFSDSDVHSDNMSQHQQLLSAQHSNQHSMQNIAQLSRGSSAVTIDGLIGNIYADFRPTPPVLNYDKHHQPVAYSEEDIQNMTGSMRALHSRPEEQQHAPLSRENSINTYNSLLPPHQQLSKHMSSGNSVGSTHSNNSSSSNLVRVPPIEIVYKEPISGSYQYMHSPEKFVLKKQTSQSSGLDGRTLSHIEIEMALPTIRNSHNNSHQGSSHSLLSPLLSSHHPNSNGQFFTDSCDDFNLSPSNNSIKDDDPFRSKKQLSSNNVHNPNSELVNGIVYNHRAGTNASTSQSAATLDRDSSPYKTESNKLLASSASEKQTAESASQSNVVHRQYKESKPRGNKAPTLSLGIDMPALNRQQREKLVHNQQLHPPHKKSALNNNGSSSSGVMNKSFALDDASVSSLMSKNSGRGAVVIPTGLQLQPGQPTYSKDNSKPLGGLATGGLGVLSNSNSSMLLSKSVTSLPPGAAGKESARGQEMSGADSGRHSGRNVTAQTIKNMQRDLLSR